MVDVDEEGTQSEYECIKNKNWGFFPLNARGPLFLTIFILFGIRFAYFIH